MGRNEAGEMRLELIGGRAKISKEGQTTEGLTPEGLWYNLLQGYRKWSCKVCTKECRCYEPLGLSRLAALRQKLNKTLGQPSTDAKDDINFE